MTTRFMTTPFSAPMTRRSALGTFALAPVAVGAANLLAGEKNEARAATSSTMLGCITGNDTPKFWQFQSFLGRMPALAMLGFNQSSPADFASSIPWVTNRARVFLTHNLQILWSVPFPGARQMEAVAAGTFDALYRTLFQSILAITPGSSNILVRLPWEFNLPFQENAAIDRTGAWNPPLFIKAWNRIAGLVRQASSRFQIIWCPNVTTMGLDPALCWPGAANVDIVTQDFYMSRQYNQPGCFSWFLNENRGLNWGVRFAQSQGKRYGLTEWGMDNDAFVGDFNAAATWLKGLGGIVHHHCWWDRPEVIDCRISDGSHPKLAAAYRAQFA